MATKVPATAERTGPCQCVHPYHTPRSPGLGPIGHPRGAEVGTLRDTETSAGLVPLCGVCRAAQHMPIEEELPR
jgi:hypothetical protein